MTAQAIERDHQARPDTTPRTRRYDQPERMPLRTDLYLIAHDQDTGQPHIDKQSIANGLAAAVLLELWHAGRIRLGWAEDGPHHTWTRNPGKITLLDATPTDDPINDAALGLLWRLGGTIHTQQFIDQFATTDLYEAVRDHLIGTRILRAFTRRRFWFFRTLAHRPNSAAYPVRARARIRNVAHLYKPSLRDTTLAALVTALGLTPYLYFTDYSTGGVHMRLAELIGPPHPIHDVTAVIAPHRITYH
jgi:hypothetical protein